MAFAKLTSGIAYIRALVGAVLEGQNRTVTNQLLHETTNSSVTADANTTYTAAQVLGGVITRTGPTVARTDAFPTAANLVAGITGAQVGDTGFLIINNNSGFAVTVNGASTGITYEGVATALATTEARWFMWSLTNVGAGTQAATVWQLV